MIRNKKLKVLKTANSWFMIAAMVGYIAIPILTLTPTAFAADTGLLSPTANASNNAGSGDDWSDPENVYTNGGGAASEINGERHRFYNFGFGIPAGSTINGIEAKVDTWSSDSSGCQLGVDLSWNGGNNWSNEKTQNLTGNEASYTLGSGTDDWGSHSWQATEFSN